MLFFAALSACALLSYSHASPSRENPRGAQQTQHQQSVSRTAVQGIAARNAASQSRAAATRSATTQANPRTAASQPRAAISARTAVAARRELAREAGGRTAQQAKEASQQRQRGLVARAATTGSSFGSAEYTQCKESYQACMDQFCIPDEKFQRCSCSNKSIDLRARLEAADSAASALETFAATDLTMVGEDAGAVAAMFSATEGEGAIPQDGDQTELTKKLNAITSSLGSGKLTGKQSNKFQMGSLSNTGTVFSFDSDMDDIWSGGKAVSAVNINLVGDALYNDVHKQCESMLKEVCSSKNLSLAVSLYKQDINKDCDKVEKSAKAKEENIKKGVTQANMMLMEARLDDFESRNSLTDLQCLEEALSTMTNENICGKNWVRCLDFTGQFMTPTGVPIYTANFPNLQDLLRPPEPSMGQMTLLDNPQNRIFSEQLDTKRIFLEGKGAFGKCRDAADRIWTQVKERALLEIKNAQREKVELVKDECISKLVSCMEVQSGAFDSLNELLDGAPTTQDHTQTKGKSNDTIAVAQLICEDIQKTCNAVFGNVFEQYLNASIDQSKVKAMCTSNLGGTWEIGSDGKQRCAIEF